MTTAAQKNVDIRQATVDDAQEFVELLKLVDSESEFLLWEPGERDLTVDQQRARLENSFNSATTRTTVACDTTLGKLFGFCWCAAGERNRTRHELSLALALLQDYHGHGIGTALLNTQIEWARSQGFRRMSLSVSPSNSAAIHIYKKAGFILEGTTRDSIKLGSRYEDSHIMGLILEN